MAVRLAAPLSAVAAGNSRPASPLCRSHHRPLQDFDHEGRRFLVPVCYDCLPSHRDECPRAQLISRFSTVALVGQVDLPELWCTCGTRRQMLALATVPEYQPDEDRGREEELERELSEG